MNDAFVANQLMVVAGIVLIPVFIWFARQRLTKNLLLIGALFCLVFSTGTLEVIGLNNSILRIVSEILVLLIFIKGVLIGKKKKKRVFPGFFWLLLFITVSVLSAVLNEINSISVLLFFRDYLVVFLFFYGVLNLTLSLYEYQKLKRLLLYLCTAQIGANIIKYLVVRDIIEPYIGTMAVLGGSLTVIFALIGTSYALANYLVSKKRIHLLWVLGFMLFSLLGGKRASIVYFPILFLLLSYVYQRRFEQFKLRGVKRFALFTILTLGLIYLSVRLMPSLNKEREVWGSFDIEYALDYTERYVTTGAGAIDAVGRSEAPIYILNMLIDDNPYSLMLGYGAGHLVKSSFNEQMVKSGSQEELTERLYGVGYGARTTFLQFLLQVGILGGVLFLIYVSRVFIYCKRSFKDAKIRLESKRNYLFFIGVVFVYFLDVFTYSTTMSGLRAPALVLFFFLALCQRVEMYNHFLTEQANKTKQ